MLVFCLVSCLIAVAFGQGAGQEYWQANFYQTSSATQSGYGYGQNAGVIRFNWPNRLFSITFGTNTWAETYSYNSNRGYPPQPTDPTAALQTRSSVGSGCNPACGVARITSAMPPLAPSLGSTYMTTQAASPCTKYTPIGGVQIVSYFTATGTGASTKICEIGFTDGRKFTIDQSTFVWTNVAIPVPTNCVCDEKMDIWILVDHSSSISDSKMLQFKTFVQQFLNALTIGPDNINVGMSWFHYKTGINFNITGNINNINNAMAKWWTNCSTAFPSQYCQDNPTDAGCAGCQQSATATSTAIQGYKGATTSPIWPGTMDVTGAMTYFYDTAHGGSARQVPKMFLTLTDGAVNCFLNQNGGIDACTFDACSPDLTTAVSKLRQMHNSKFPTMSLTTVSMGIGVTGTDPNLSLSPGHLLILAEGKPENTFMVDNFASLSSYLNNLLLLSCPATNDIVQDTCLQSCCGLCVCGQCKPPSSCFNNNNCTQQVLNLCCNEIPAPIAGVCPTSNPCINAVCDPTLEDGDGACVYTPVNCSSFANGCTKYTCTLSGSKAGTCSTADTSACPPVNCQWGPWSAWSSCSVTCGSGTQTQSRTQNQTAANGGLACSGSSTNSQPCTVSSCCPVACKLSSWTQWTATCTQCGVGNTSRYRNVTSLESCGGATCSTDQYQTKFCPACVSVNCSGYNSTTGCVCTGSDQNYTAVRTYYITANASGPLGLPCPYPDRTQWLIPCTSYQISKCPRDCNETWTSWSLCDCNYNTQNRSYIIYSFPVNGGKACSFSNNQTQQQACTPTPSQNCPLYGPLCTTNADCADQYACTQDLCLLKPDGQYHCDWKTPTNCSINYCLKNNTCDQTLGCVKTYKSLSVACPSSPCNRSVCDETANGGRGGCVYTPVNCSGVAPIGCQTWVCDPTYGTCSKPDRSACPPIDCSWNSWGAWSSCSRTCGGGTQTMVRTKNITEQDGGTCSGSSTNKTTCNTQCCPVDCVYNSWSSWSFCPLCSTDNHNRTRTIRSNATCGGDACNSTLLFDQRQCPPCTPQNCTGKNITGKCNCTADGTSGTTIYTFEVVQPAVGNGTNCSMNDGDTWVGPCTPTQVAQCPTPCVEVFDPVGGNWSECNCYNFTQYRNYQILKPPTNNGTACTYATNFSQTQPCVPEKNCTDLGPPCASAEDCNDELACTVDQCIWIAYANGYHCSWVESVTCNSTNICQTQYCDQTVGCRKQNLTSDVACPAPDLCTISFCNVSGNGGNGACQYAPKDCSAFSDGCVDYNCDIPTGDCSLPNRTRCPPIDCTWGDWSEWSTCTVTCGNSTVARTRTVNRTAQDGGANCTGNNTDVQDCNAGCCPVDCQMSEWGPWSQAACTLCGTEKQVRNRTVLLNASCGGTPCGNETDDSLVCPPCQPVDCSGHNITTPCNCTPDGTAGTRVRIFVVDVAQVGTGRSCPFADGQNWTEPCNATEINGCPKPCKDMFTNWSECDCFNSTQHREYVILSPAQNGGTPCLYPAEYSQNQTCTPSKDCPNLGPVCVNASDCDDGLACTVDRCILFTPPGTYHCDWSQNLTCDDNSVCTSDRCDQLLGCVFTPALFCEDSNNCTIDTCDPVLGCVNTNVTCPDADVCNLGVCDPVTGCGVSQRNCSENVTADNCTVVYCDVNYTTNGAKGPCATQNVCSETAILAIGIGAGIIAAIVILGLLALALCSGGAYAAATNMAAINENAVQVNPLYHGAGYEADNPLFNFGGGETV